MKLIDLEASFVGQFNPATKGFCEHQSVEDAQGVLFVCPKCQNHSVLVWFANPRLATVVPVDSFPKNKSRWTFSGEIINELTLNPSVDLSQITSENPAEPLRCYWHGWVKNGDAT